jgi:hypothetical protein
VVDVRHKLAITPRTVKKPQPARQAAKEEDNDAVVK